MEKLLKRGGRMTSLVDYGETIEYADSQDIFVFSVYFLMYEPCMWSTSALNLYFIKNETIPNTLYVMMIELVSPI
jgi:hypothetical protein